MILLSGKYTKAKIMIDEVEESCVAQINTLINHPAFHRPVAIMPDTHTGKGSVIGFTMELTDKIIPNVIGVDIGCGICSVNVGPTLSLSFEALDRKIRKAIPFGYDVHDQALISMKNDFPWHEAQVVAETFALNMREKMNISLDPPQYNQDWFLDKANHIGGNARRVINSIGTLGGGNHFIETGIADNGDYWITVHSGSRNFGKKICEYWQGKAAKYHEKQRKNRAKSEIAKLHDRGDYNGMKKQKRLLKNSTLDDHIKGLEFLEGDMAGEYLFDMIFAQIYAQVNRKYMLDTICALLQISARDRIESIHNYIDFNDLIIRKGAIRSYKDQRMVIPFSMADGICICEGTSNKEWNYSAPHGAGRVMSRTEAKRTLDVEIFRKQMQGIYSTSVGKGTIDESPQSYKDATLIERLITDTATILFKIKPVHNMKDTSGSD